MLKSEILENLRKTIELDPTYFVKAKSDKNLNTKPEVNHLLDEIEQKAKTRAKSAIAEAETSFSRAPKIRANAEQVFRSLRENSVLRSKTTYEESKTKYKYAQTRFEFAKLKVASGEYIALLEAKQIAEESQNVVNESYKIVNSAIDIATIEEKRAIKEEKYRKKEKTKNIITTIIFSPFILIKASLIGLIGYVIGGVIGAVIALIILVIFSIDSDTINIILIAGGAGIGFIIIALGSIMEDIENINKK